MHNLVNFVISTLSNIVDKDIIVFIISLMPVLELRGGLIAASIFKIEYVKAALICIIGNILPIPFILLFLKKLMTLLEKFTFTKSLVEFLNKKAERNKAEIDKYGYIGLTLFVGIPLPGTGAWTGALVASAFDMDIKKSFVAIFVGVLIAFAIMSIISYGLIWNISA